MHSFYKLLLIVVGIVFLNSSAFADEEASEPKNSVSIQGFFGGDLSKRIEFMSFGDGTVLDLRGMNSAEMIEARVNAMKLEQSTLVEGYMQTLKESCENNNNLLVVDESLSFTGHVTKETLQTENDVSDGYQEYFYKKENLKLYFESNEVKVSILTIKVLVDQNNVINGCNAILSLVPNVDENVHTTLLYGASFKSGVYSEL